ncbi:5-formyltetrahydrofolate cyclo-ligase [Acetobacterium tundrae]|uniref:5-formyltetrahydrofolate cyclo-ligase n=1 Tax=Acetobacterium tundrae TaxID=132932 RepID=A0ABR6WHG1_9FIRM|nr:5-formyltetrahydrofolate cyclo-ligase [Acetobacterium tundrae]MBC3795903.1 5-formyltetrahydrofolate cyclo-ligase [Acetobacterium tundrae]
MDKTLFRKEILTRRKEIYSADTDTKIINNFLASDLYKNADWIMAYVSFGTEIYTHDFIKKALADGKHIVVPICNPDHTLTLSEIVNFPADLEEGHYGILEVRKDCLRIVDAKQLDLVMVPGCAFSPCGHRMGFGGGYYDRFLETINDDCVTVALIREDFIFAEIPMEEHDKSVNFMVTEKCQTCCATQED